MYFLIISIYFLFPRISSPEELWTNYNISYPINCISGHGEYIWMGTDGGGVIKMDIGDSSQLQYTKENDGLGSNNVQYVAIDDLGKVCIGERGMYSPYGWLSFFENNSWKLYKKDTEGLAGNDIMGIKVDNANTFWVALNDSYFEGTGFDGYFITRQIIQYFENATWNIKKIETQSIRTEGNWGMHIDDRQILDFDLINSGYFVFGHLTSQGYLSSLTTSDNIESGIYIDNFDGSWLHPDRIFKVKIEQKENIKIIWINALYNRVDNNIVYAYSDSLFKLRYFWTILEIPISGFTHTSGPIILENNNSKWFVDRDQSNNKYLIKYDDINYIPYTCPDWTPATEITAFYADDQGYIWIGTQSDGLFRFDVKNATIVQAAHQTPAEFTLSAAYPNPFNAQTTISFTLTKPSKVNLSIYSLTGQKVRELAAGAYSTGKHTMTLDGKNENGEMVSSGVYMARMECGGQSKVVRMAMVK